MERTALRFAQVEKINRQAIEVGATAAVMAVILFPPYGLPLAIGLAVVAYVTYQFATQIRKAMGFDSRAAYKAFKFSPEGLALGQSIGYNMALDPFFVDPSVASPELVKAQRRRKMWRKISFAGGIASGVMPVVSIAGLLGLGATGAFMGDGAPWGFVIIYGWVALWFVALIAAFGGLFAAFAARLKIQRLVVFGG